VRKRARYRASAIFLAHTTACSCSRRNNPCSPGHLIAGLRASFSSSNPISCFFCILASASPTSVHAVSVIASKLSRHASVVPPPPPSRIVHCPFHLIRSSLERTFVVSSLAPSLPQHTRLFSQLHIISVGSLAGARHSALACELEAEGVSTLYRKVLEGASLSYVCPWSFETVLTRYFHSKIKPFGESYEPAPGSMKPLPHCPPFMPFGPSPSSSSPRPLPHVLTSPSSSPVLVPVGAPLPSYILEGAPCCSRPRPHPRVLLL
jgi:hypothetical protein